MHHRDNALLRKKFHSRQAGIASLSHTGCNNELLLDQGYRVYYVDVASAVANISMEQQPLVIFAAVHNFPAADWVLSSIAKGQIKDEEVLFKTWKPFRLNRRYPTNYAYVKMTNWYSHYMLQLRILDFFDYGGKLDNDVSFVAPFPEPNLPRRLARNNTYMMGTQNGWYYDDPRISQGVLHCLQAFTDEETKYCNTHRSSELNGGKVKLVPRGRRDMHFWESTLNVTLRAHFLVYWLGLYTAPEVGGLHFTYRYFYIPNRVM